MKDKNKPLGIACYILAASCAIASILLCLSGLDALAVPAIMGAVILGGLSLYYAPNVWGGGDCGC